MFTLNQKQYNKLNHKVWADLKLFQIPRTTGGMYWSKEYARVGEMRYIAKKILNNYKFSSQKKVGDNHFYSIDFRLDTQSKEDTSYYQLFLLLTPQRITFTLRTIKDKKVSSTICKGRAFTLHDPALPASPAYA